MFMLLISIYSIAQPNSNSNSNKSTRTIEVYGYAYEEVLPNAVYASFVLKEYKDKEGKLVTISQSEKLLTEVLKKMNCHKSSLSIGNIYGYIGTNDDKSEEIFKHKVQFILKLESFSCVHIFLDKIDKKAIESFNIDGVYYEKSDSLKRRIQVHAIKIAKEKAIKLLDAIGETCGDVIDVQEVNGRLITPDINGKGAVAQVVNYNDGVNFNSFQSNITNMVRFDYTIRATFLINPK